MQHLRQLPRAVVIPAMPHHPETPSPRSDSPVGHRFRQADRLSPSAALPFRHSAAPATPPLRHLAASTRQGARTMSACSVLAPPRGTRCRSLRPFVPPQRRAHQQTCRTLAPLRACGEQVPNPCKRPVNMATQSAPPGVNRHRRSQRLNAGRIARPAAPSHRPWSCKLGPPRPRWPLRRSPTVLHPPNKALQRTRLLPGSP